ncbi:probable ATP-dependent RNA helicase DDX53 [Pectinophora gossypiella]|uniref:probable ATP-dependent RNA helicase DDX53 n=1 Tax=Pectinophora gossypiella TaxID=13191 RepID=UPI00214EC490|nr:probable ATP-dependent RNA helicase DDX53 [Pectinophora gossypiella]
MAECEEDGMKNELAGARGAAGGAGDVAGADGTGVPGDTGDARPVAPSGPAGGASSTRVNAAAIAAAAYAATAAAAATWAQVTRNTQHHNSDTITTPRSWYGRRGPDFGRRAPRYRLYFSPDEDTDNLINCCLEVDMASQQRRMYHEFVIESGTVSLPEIHPQLGPIYHPHGYTPFALPLVKDFYREDPEVTAMTNHKITMWRENNETSISRLWSTSVGRTVRPVFALQHVLRNFPGMMNIIRRHGFTRPTPIQSQAWPVIMKGEDMIAVVPTGRGKTLAFIIPAFIHINGQLIQRDKKDGPMVLILALNREQVEDINREILKYKYDNITSVCLYYNRRNNKKQIRALKRGADIVVATPRRFHDLVMAEHVKTSNLSYIVVYEADKMLEMGYEGEIIQALAKVRPDKQTVTISTTWPYEVRRVAQQFMNDPLVVRVGGLNIDSISPVTPKFKFLKAANKLPALLKFINKTLKQDTIIFCGDYETASQIATALLHNGIEYISLPDDRVKEIDGSINIILATDVLVDELVQIRIMTNVVNYDFPPNMEEYVSRIGLTGNGAALTFITKKDIVHAKDLAKVLEAADKIVPDELAKMVDSCNVLKLVEDIRAREAGAGGSDSRSRRGKGKYRRGLWPRYCN